MLNAGSWFIFLGCFCVLVSGQTDSRHLRDYESGPVFDQISYFAKASVRRSSKEYLQKVWKEKRRSHFKVSRYSREGVKTTCEYFVEPSADSTWQVVVSCSSEEDPLNPSDSPKEKPTEQIFDTLIDFGTKGDVARLDGGAELLLSNSKTGETHRF
jgi:hypothetical protein